MYLKIKIEKERQIAFSLMTERNISYAEIAPLVERDNEANGVTNQYNIDDFFADLNLIWLNTLKMRT